MDPSGSWKGSYEIRSVHPSVCPSVFLSRHFLGIVYLVFSKFWHGTRNPYEVVWQSWNLQKKIFLPRKSGKWAKNGSKQDFLNLLKNFVINFYRVFSIMKIFVTYCFRTQIIYLRKFLFLRYEPKYSQPTRLQDFLINHISRTNHWNSMFIQIYRR